MDEEKAEQLAKKLETACKVWEAKYGEERAMVIAKKMASPGFVEKESILDIIKTGDKWHYANLLFNGKISNEEFSKNFDQ